MAIPILLTKIATPRAGRMQGMESAGSKEQLARQGKKKVTRSRETGLRRRTHRLTPAAR